MKGFVLYHTKVGTHIVSGMYEPGMGLSGQSSTADATQAATNIASMAFGISLTARTAVGGLDAEEHQTKHQQRQHHSKAADPLKENETEGDQRFIPSSEILEGFLGVQNQLPATSGGDHTPNAASIPFFDDGITSVYMYEHQVAPIGALVTMATGVGGSKRLAEGLCKGFVSNFGVEYLSAMEKYKKLKNYKKLFKPVVRSVVQQLARESLVAFVKQSDLESSVVQWSSAMYSPELSVAVEAQNLCAEEIQRMLKLKRPPEKAAKKKKKKVESGAASIDLGLDEDVEAEVDDEQHLTSSFVNDALKVSCFFDSFQLPEEGQQEESPRGNNDVYSDAESEGEGTVEVDPSSDGSVSKKTSSRARSAVLTNTIFQLQAMALSAPSRSGSCERTFQVDTVVNLPQAHASEREEGKENNANAAASSSIFGSTHLQRVRVLVSGDFYLILALGHSDSCRRSATAPTGTLPAATTTASDGWSSARGVDALADLKQHTKALYRSILRDE